MNKKKLLALLMALVMTLSLVPVTALASETDATDATVTNVTENLTAKTVEFVFDLTSADDGSIYNLDVKVDKAFASGLTFYIKNFRMPVNGGEFTANESRKLLGNIVSTIEAGNQQMPVGPGFDRNTLVQYMNSNFIFTCGVQYDTTAVPAGTTMTVQVVKSSNGTTWDNVGDSVTCVLNPVAAIGDTGYATLDGAVDDAVDAVTTIDTVKLLQDITYDENHSVAVWEKAVNLDLNGQKLTTNSGVGKNLPNMGYTAAAICYGLEDQGTVTISNGTIKTAYGAGVYAAGSDLEVTLEDLTINAGTVGTQDTPEYTSAVRISSGAKVIINSGSYTSSANALAVSNSGGEFVVNGGTFNGDIFFNTGTNAGVTKSITINGGTFTSNFVNTSKGSLVIKGGTFNNDPSTFVPAGFEVVKNGNGTWTVVSAGTAVAQIGNVKYATLQAAFAAATAGQTVELIRDLDLTGTEWNPIDNPNGVNFDGQNHTISNLTCNVSAESGQVAGLFGIVQNSPTIENVNLTNVTITNGSNASEQATAGYGGRFGAIVGRMYGGTISNCIVENVTIQDMGHIGGIVGATEGNTTIEDCTVRGHILLASGSNSGGGWDVGGILGKNNGGSVTISDCVVSGDESSRIYSQFAAGGILGFAADNQSSTITGCSVSDVTVEASSNGVDIKAVTRIGAGGIIGSLKGTISGCTVNGVTVQYDDTGSNPFAAVGLIGAAPETGGNPIATVSNCTVTNSKGVWGDTEVYYLDPGHNTNNSVYAVVYTNTAVAKIVNNGVTTYYATLADAIATAQSGETITLLSDIALTATVNITKDLTIDLNGHDITATNARALHVKSGDVTITGSGTISAGGTDLDETSSVIRVGDSAANTAAAKLTIESGVTVSSDRCYGITAFGNNDKDSNKATADITLTVDGTVSVSGNQAAISGNGTNTLSATTMTINGTVTAANDYAIYHPGKGTLTVNGTVTGYGGIEAKSGTVTIADTAHVTANAQTQSHTANNNGTSTSGYAIAAISNTGYVGDPTVIINSNGVSGKVIMLVDGNADLNAVVKANSNYESILSDDGFEWKYDENDGVYVLTEVVDYTAEPTWQWHVINGEWKAIATYKTAAGSSVVQICGGYKTSVTQGTIVYTASNGYCDAPQKVVEQQYHVSYSQDPSQVDQTTYSWGEICTLHADVLSNWFIVEGNKEVKIAAATETYSFAVTGDVVIESVEAIGEEAEPQAIVYATMKSTESGKAEFQTKWSIPKGASVQSVTIYRGYTSTEKTITADTLIAKGTRYDANLNVLNGDFLLRLTGLTSNTYQHAVIVIKYRAGTEVKTLKSDVLNVHVL